MWSRRFNFLVNDLSVFKNLTRFCFSVPYALCIEKNNDKKNNKILPSYTSFIKQLTPNTETHTHKHTHTHIRVLHT